MELSPHTNKHIQSRKKYMVLWVSGIFFVVCVLWVIALQLGFSDFQGTWISGTKTYNAQGEETSVSTSTSITGAWHEAKERMSTSWNIFLEAMNKLSSEEATQTEATSTQTATNTSL